MKLKLAAPTFLLLTSLAACSLEPNSLESPTRTSLVAKTNFLVGCPDVINTTMPRLQDEKPINLCSLHKKVTLVVNTASKCGYTRQFEQLEQLHKNYSSKGLTIMGFPTGDFSNQELQTNEEIADFCKNTFGVEFPMFAKSSVKPESENLNTVFAYLYKAGAPAPKWNFNKYLILEDGSIHHFESKVPPLNSEIERLILESIESKKESSE